MSKFKILFFFFLVTISYSLYSENSPYQFLRVNSSARAAALAGSIVAMPDDPSALYFNPASIATVKEKMLSFTFFKHVLDINSGNVSYIKKFDDLGIFAGSVVYTNYGSFDKSDKYGNKSSTFSANDLAFAVSYSNELDENLYWGATVKFLYVNIENANSTGFAVDAGLLYLIPDKRTNLGLSILHAGSQITAYQDLSESIPLDIRLGVNHRLQGLPLLLNFSFHHLADNTSSFFDKFLNFSIGGEIYLSDNIQARVGYDNQIRRYSTPSNDKKLSGFTGGVGIKTKYVNIDYGIAQVGTAGYLHRLSASLDLE